MSNRARQLIEARLCGLPETLFDHVTEQHRPSRIPSDPAAVPGPLLSKCRGAQWVPSRSTRGPTNSRAVG